MNNVSLAVKYRPTTFDDVVEQKYIIKILQNQIQSNNIRNAYLFCGPAGDGKTTCARIFANEINKGIGTPIEMDAASNNSIEDVRRLNIQAQMKSLAGEYKIFILDECHALSNSAWQAMLKLIEEPPAKTMFIFCTTDPQKIPKTILSRVQRFNFQRVTYEGILERLRFVCKQEQLTTIEDGALQYIAKYANGGMRDALTYLDKVLSYSSDITVENVVKALGLISYDDLLNLTVKFSNEQTADLIAQIERMYIEGIDLKFLIKSWLLFVLDIKKYQMIKNTTYVSIPTAYISDICNIAEISEGLLMDLLVALMKLNDELKYEADPKSRIECELIVLNEVI